MIILVAAALAALAIFLWHVPNFTTSPAPASTPAEAITRFAAIEKAEAALPLRPEGRSRIFSHGYKTDRVFVLLHGLTNCPEQFVPFARILFASGANVVVPRSRYAGYADRMNAEQGLQSAQDLIEQAATGLDLAAGLGNRISVVGLSGSAVAAAWMAQNRPGIEQVVLVSPFFGLHGHPVPMIDGLASLLAIAPNTYKWWDDQLMESLPGPAYAYPRYGTFCMADTIRLSRNVRANFDSRPLQTSRLDILTTGTDKGANNALTGDLARKWSVQKPGAISIHEFPESEGIPHDMIDPNQPGAKTGLVYKKLLEVLGVRPGGAR